MRSHGDRGRTKNGFLSLYCDIAMLGLAPLVIGVYFIGSVQLFFIGLLGEYIGSIHTQVHRHRWWSRRSASNFHKPSPATADRTARAADGLAAEGSTPQAFVAASRTDDPVLSQ